MCDIIFLGNEVCMAGMNIPWNTLNVWNLSKLRPFGFQLVSDGIVPSVNGAIEEVCTMAMIQCLKGKNENVVKLISFSDCKEIKSPKWNIHFTDSKRIEYHKWKMSTKNERAKNNFKHWVYRRALSLIYRLTNVLTQN